MNETTDRSTERTGFTEHGQIDGAAAQWYERKGRIYVDDGCNGDTSADVGVIRIFKNTGRLARRGELFPRTELVEIAALSTRGLGHTRDGAGDLPKPLGEA